VKGTRVVLPDAGNVTDLRFYSHAASGNPRLAIYDSGSPRNLLWQSAPIVNSAAGAWITAPIAGGFPSSLALAPGTYWLTWQVDSTADVASYSPGSSGDGFFLEQPFGAFPQSLSGEQASSETWSLFIDYDLASSPPPASAFYPVTPCRVLDTRGPIGTYGGPSLAGASTRTFTVSGVCGIPLSARAVSVNLTVIGPAASGSVTVFAGGNSPPSTPSVYFSQGQTRANNAFLSLGGAGDIAVFSGIPPGSGALDFLLDVNGYFQ
jgi:hypothetical protein